MRREDNRILILSVMTSLILVLSVFAVMNNSNNFDSDQQRVEYEETEENPGMEELLSDNKGMIESQLSAGEYKIIEDDEEFHWINMLTSGYGVIDSPGDPILPEKMLEFKVPQNIDWSSVELVVEIEDSEVLSGEYNIPPNPPVIADDSEYEFWGYDNSVIDGKNIRVYSVDSNYPEEAVKMLPYTERQELIQSGFEQASYVRIVYRPFLYNPVTQELTFIQKANIQINYEYLPGSSRGTRGSSYDYVIITTNDIVANSEMLEYFINLKEITHDVLVVTEDDFLGLAGQAPNGRAEKIRQWLKDNDPVYSIDYALLIGDPDPDDPLDPGDTVGDIPMKMCMPRYFCWDSRESPTDLFYADLTGNWDLDGDQFYGECFDVAHEESPDPMYISTDYFSARWTGFVHCDHTETYQFQTFSDDGVRLWIDGSLEIDHWTEHMPTNNYTTLAMTAGDHPITLEFREHTDDAITQLMWKTMVAEGDPTYVPHQIIPKDHLRNETGAADGLTGRYYNNIYLTGSPDLVKPDGEEINFLWGTGDDGPGGPETGAEVYIGRIPVYSNNYTQLDKILEKIIKYETEPGSLAWRKSILLPMEPMDKNTPCAHLGEGIKNDLADPMGFTSYRIYEEDYNPPTPELWPCNPNNVMNEWKNGYGMVTWATHGGQEGASDIFETALCPQLDDTKPSFTMQTSCNTGWPENPNNLAYSLLKNGAIATVGATRVSWYSGGNWTTYDPTSGTYHPTAYFYTKGIIYDGYPAGMALAKQKEPIPKVGMNEMDFNLYGDPDCALLSVVPNMPPVADANGPYISDEGQMITFNASGSYDPDAFPLPLEYRWDFENDGIWDTSWSTSSTATYTWSDDYSGEIALEVNDGVLKDSDITNVTVYNVAPSITPFGPFSGDEPYFVSITTDASDLGSDDLTFEWVFDYGPTITNVFYNDGMGPDPYPSAVGGTYPFTVIDSASHEYSDNGNYSITLTVTDDDGAFTVYTTYVVVDNVDPTIENLEAYILVNFTLRAAGEKWHNVEMFIKENDVNIAYAEVVRYPGSPDDQSVTLYSVKCDVTKYINITVLYTPMDDPINGQINGATPVWVTLDFEDGEDNRLHHTCNVRHKDTWEWNFGVNQFFVGHNITFESNASDPGSDDLTFDWFWDDGTSNTVTTYYNDGINPDPFPSPDGIYPFSAHDETKHMFMNNDCFDVKLTVTDDDGGVDVIVVIVIII